jgi:hypothetical protein
VTIGDLMAEEERHVVVRFAFPPGVGARSVRGRVTWQDGGRSRSTDWQTVRFAYADQAACDAEPMDPAVMHWVGLHHADQARLAATELNRQGDYQGAHRKLETVAQRIAGYADQDPELQSAVRELQSFQPVAAAPMPTMVAKETVGESLRRSRGQRDHR